MKFCIKCNIVKPFKMFCKDKYRKDGYHPYCTPCKVAPYVVGKARILVKRQIKIDKIERKCTSCNRVLKMKHFHNNKNRLDGKGQYCKPCARRISLSTRSPERSRQLYVSKRGEILLGAMKNRENRKLEIIDMLGGKCLVCGVSPMDGLPSACFDFHHVDPTMKDLTISRLISRKDWKERIHDELQKCVVLCANCHRRHHAFAPR